jgi:glycosyltransferase involved in cell wall biosynthesis
MLSRMSDASIDTPPRLPLPLSVAIVCKNNAGTMGRTLESVRGLAHEIVAVDSGSTDGTIEILEQHGARVIRSEWLGHVKTKQKALEACTQDWVLCLDSDESIDEKLRSWLEDFGNQVLEECCSPSDDYWWIRRVTWYNGRPLRHAWQPEWRIRLVTKRGFRWGGLDPHDKLERDDGKEIRFNLALTTEGSIRHESIGTWSDFLAKQATHARTMAMSLYAAGKKPSYLRLFGSPIGAVLKQLVLKSAWRDGWPGVLAAMSTGVGAAMKHMMLFEIASMNGTSKNDGGNLNGDPNIDRTP